MWEDPIVKEIHEIREKIASEHNYDARALVKHYQQKQQERGRKTVTRLNRRTQTSYPSRSGSQ